MAAHPRSPVPGILQARTLEWVAISFSNAWKWKVKVKSLSRVWLLATPWTVAHQAPPPKGFSRQEYWSGVPLPSPILHANYSTKIFKAHPILTEQVLGPGIPLSLAGKLLIIIQLWSVAGKCIAGSVQGNWCVGESRKPLEEMTFSLIIKGNQAITVRRKLVGMSPTSSPLIQGKRDAWIGQVHKQSGGWGLSLWMKKQGLW